MALAYTILRLVQGAEVIDLVDGDNYQLTERGYSPSVPSRRNGALSGHIYHDVQEEIRVNIRGTDGPTLHDNVSRLVQVLDNIDRYRLGYSDVPTYLEVQPQGSELTAPVRFLLTGRPGSGDFLSLPSSYNDLLQIHEIPDVAIRYTRRGLGYSETETPATTVAKYIPDTQIVAFAGEVDTPSYVKLEIGGFSNVSMDDAYLFYAVSPNDMVIIEGEDGGSAEAAIIPDAGHLPSGGLILRFTAPNTDWHSITFPSPGIFGGQWELFALVRNNHPVAVWKVYAEALSWTGSDDDAPRYATARTRYVQIGPEGNKPQVVRLGSLYRPNTSYALQLDIQIDRADLTPTLDIDYLIAIDVSNEHNRVIKVLGNEVHRPGNITLFPGELSRSPSVLALPSGYVLGYEGNPRLTMTGETVALTVMAPRDEDWRWKSVPGGNDQQITLTATRYKGHILPE